MYRRAFQKEGKERKEQASIDIYKLRNTLYLLLRNIKLNKICMLAYYDCIITRETFRSKLSRTFKLAKKQQASIFLLLAIDEPNQFYVSNYSLSFIPSCPSRSTNIRIKLRRILLYLTSLFHLLSREPFISILTNVFPRIFFKLRRSDFHSFRFIQKYSKICTRIRELPSCFTPRIVHTELIQLRYKFQRDSPNSTIRYFTQTFSSFFFQI